MESDGGGTFLELFIGAVAVILLAPPFVIAMHRKMRRRRRARRQHRSAHRSER